MDRQQKIALLESIGSGSMKIEDLVQKRLLIRINNNGNEYFIDGHKFDKEYYKTEQKKQLVLFGHIPICIGFYLINDDGSYTPFEPPDKFKNGNYPEIILFYGRKENGILEMY